MKFRRIVFHLHCYIGLVAGLFLIAVSLTGSLIVFREEIEALIYPELMTTEVRDERIPVQSILDTVNKTFPQDDIFSLRMPRLPEQTYLLKMNNPHDLFIYADPYSGELIGAHQQKDTLMGWITLLHTQLLLGEQGKMILGIGGLLLIGMCATGFYLWFPSNGRFFQGFRINWLSSWKKIIFDIHRVLGIYTALFLLMAGLTGVFLVFNKTTTEIVNFLTVSPPRPAPPLSDPSKRGGGIPSIDAILEHADLLLPAQTTWVSFPQAPQSPWVVRKKVSAELHPNGRSFIYFDQYTGEALLIENGLIAPLGTHIYNLFYPLHVGTAGGFPGRILQAMAGFLTLALLLTGFIMWRNKRKVGANRKNYRKSFAEYSRSFLRLLFLRG